MTVTADDTVLEAILRRDRQVVVAALIVMHAEEALGGSVWFETFRLRSRRLTTS